MANFPVRVCAIGLLLIVLVACSQRSAVQVERGASGIEHEVFEQLPAFQGLTDEQIIERADRQREASDNRIGIAFQRLTLAEAREKLSNLWLPTYLPRQFDERHTVVALPSDDALQATPELGRNPPIITYIGRNGEMLMVTVAQPKPDLVVPVGAGGARDVRLDEHTTGLIVQGLWHISISQDRTRVTQRWDSEGPKRALLQRGQWLYDVEISPGDALTDQELLKIAASISLNR